MFDFKPGDRLFYMQRATGAMGELTGLFLFKQLIDVVGYLHESVGVVHGDLKLSNIYLDTTFKVNLIEFGLASYTNINRIQKYMGT
jgi:serine/threonine protein kinase